ncbi:MAG: glycoside hydrolase family 9 protein [Cytophagaceae bacterium]
MKTSCYVLLFLLVLPQSVHAARYVRYNQAGYLPDQVKRVIIMSDDNCSGLAWRVKNSSSSLVLDGNLGASAAGAGNFMPKAFNYVIDFSTIQEEGIYTIEIDEIESINIRISCRPYEFMLEQVLRMFRVRRSGSEDCLDHEVSHLGDASCLIWRRNGTDNGSWSPDAGEKKVDMLGGWYDAGDYIKFTLTNAYSAYFLLRSYELMPEIFREKHLYSQTELNDMLDEIKHGLDFLLKTMPDEDEFIIQTGGYLDHQQWPARLPENDALDGQRECYSAFSRTQMGLTAAALALGAKVFRSEGYSAYADVCEAKAIQIFAKAKASTEAVAWWQGGHEIFYADNSLNDNMELAAIELYNLTSVAQYLTDAQSYGNAAGAGYWAAWSNLNMSAHSRLLPHFGNISTSVNNDLNYFAGIANTANNLWKTPHNSTWASLYSFFAVGHGVLQYELASGNGSHRNMATSVLDYTFGLNPWGLGFIATQDLPNTITSSYATIYSLQPHLFPIGEIAEGPAPQATHAAQRPYFYPAHNPSLWHSEFNTTNFTFFEQPGDYVCMETIISGLADGLWLMTLATNLCDAPMSLDIIDFSGKTESNTIKLDWKVYSQHSLAFAVERSADGTEFVEIGYSDNSSGNNNTRNYTFTDPTPSPGINYYRLRIMNGDEFYAYSSVVAVSNGEDDDIALSVYPNPFSDQVSLALEIKKSAKVKVEIINSLGQVLEVVLQKEFSAGNHLHTFTNSLPEGIYFCRVTSDGRTSVSKIIVRH